jgi:hypothetical protein
MTLKEYDAWMEIVWDLKRKADSISRSASIIEMETHQDAGLEQANRDPGFPCWTIQGMPGYFNTPMEAIAALEAKRNP